MARATTTTSRGYRLKRHNLETIDMYPSHANDPRYPSLALWSYSYTATYKRLLSTFPGTDTCQICPPQMSPSSVVCGTCVSGDGYGAWKPWTRGDIGVSQK